MTEPKWGTMLKLTPEGEAIARYGQAELMFVGVDAHGNWKVIKVGTSSSRAFHPYLFMNSN